jgi:mRNA interferase MazF
MRPAVVVSVDRFNESPAGLVVIVPLTSVDKGVRLHVRIEPPEGGLSVVSFAKTEDIRSVSIERLGGRLGRVSDRTLTEVGRRLTALLGLVSP